MNRGIFIILITLLHVALFLYAAVSKLMDYYNFEFGLSESPFISAFAGILAWTVPGVELLIVVLLLLPVTRLAGLYASFVLMLSFTVYIAAMLLSSAEIPCSCGGVLEELSWPMHIVFNSVFVVLSAIGIVLERKRRKVRKTIPTNFLTPLYAKRYPTAADTH
jgi:hypothetical protein